MGDIVNINLGWNSCEKLTRERVEKRLIEKGIPEEIHDEIIDAMVEFERNTHMLAIGEDVPGAPYGSQALNIDFPDTFSQDQAIVAGSIIQEKINFFLGVVREHMLYILDERLSVQIDLSTLRLENQRLLKNVNRSNKLKPIK